MRLRDRRLNFATELVDDSAELAKYFLVAPQLECFANAFLKTMKHCGKQHRSKTSEHVPGQAH